MSATEFGTVSEPEIDLELAQSTLLQRVGASAAVKCLAAAAVFSSVPAPVKGEGPYTSAHIELNLGSIYAAEASLIPARPAKALRLSSTLGGVISTTGYSIMADRYAIEPYLNSRRFAVIQQTDIEAGGDKKDRVTQNYALTSWRKPLTEDLTTKQLKGFRKLVDAQEANGGAIGNATKYSKANIPPNLVQIGDGLVSHADGPTNISFTVYDFTKDGRIVPILRKTATATEVDNVSCPESPVTVSSEVELTRDQKSVVCNGLRTYQKLVASGTHLTLDAAPHDNDTADSSAISARSILLTYPYIGTHPVPEQTFDRIMLHEFLHNAYTWVAPKSVVEEVDAAYSTVRQSMRYAFPSEAVQYMSGESVGQVEPVWNVLTESTYIGKTSWDGHPWDNATEMSSSTASTLATFPDQFCRHFKSLSLQEKQAVYQVVLATGSLVRSTGVAPSEVIPQYDAIVTQLEEAL
jgi:hypothetical protein